ncbi:ankyrin repeat domain-containing protein [Streptomyces sp. NPDC058240]|uniref:ankyrin repeat domain-containing protein n=1 Tax=Streptomyces sp. NPDC058240 TaxID=3346396 RepID=UPI0036F14F0D
MDGPRRSPADYRHLGRAHRPTIHSETGAQRNMDDTQLVAAVRRGDTDAVTALLEGGAVTDTVTDDGLPVLCLAVAAYDVAVAEALVEGGADPDRKLPDGTTPLIRAIDGGSPAVAEAVLGREPRLRLSEVGREQLLALARHWYERSAEDELHGRTGGSGPVRQSLVMDDEYNHVSQLTLGGLTVKAVKL